MVTKNLVDNAKKLNSSGVTIKGPVRLPNKHLRICTRRSPCGEGSKTWDNFEMTIFKRYIDITCTTSQIKEITMFQIPSSIQISVDFIEKQA
jgi:small subunit ribosomal protein S20e